jgi:hypothetical protein
MNNRLPLRIVSALLVAIGAPMLFSQSACAGFIVGTVGFNIQGSVSASNLDLSTAISFANVRTNNTASLGWSQFTSSHFSGGLLAMDQLTVGSFSSVGKTLSFSNAGFGSFTGKVISDNMRHVDVGFLRSSTRSVVVDGIFTPGTTLANNGFNQQVIGKVSIFLVGFTGPLRSSPSARAGTVVMSTQPVPEPGTIVMASIGAATLFGMMRRRKVSRPV